MPVAILKIIKGRSLDQKRALVKAVTGSMTTILGAPRERVVVLLEEIERENWGSGGELHLDKYGTRETGRQRNGESEERIKIREKGEADADWVDGLMRDRWGGEEIVSRGRLSRPSRLPGFIAEEGGERTGLLTFEIRGDECEIVTLDSLSEGKGVGTGLMEAVRQKAASAGCSRLWLITTNDNLKAVRFYQKRGYALAALHLNAVEESRKLKPSIALTGEDGIAIRDEIELELNLGKP